MKDEEPHDYAVVERVFPKGFKKQIEFKFRAMHLPQGTSVQIEVQDQQFNRALRLRIDRDWLSFDIAKISVDPLKVDPTKWHHVMLKIDCEKGTYQPVVDGKVVHEEIELGTDQPEVERILIRTGTYRGHVPADVAEHGIDRQSGFFSEDLPGADVKAPLIEFHLDDIKTKGN
jgi:hypothetical protein